MKKTWLFIAIVLFFSACESILDSPPPDFVIKSYINTFVECGEISGKKLQIRSDVGLKIDAVKKIIYWDYFWDMDAYVARFPAPHSISDNIWLNIEARSTHFVDRDSSVYYAVPQIGRTDFLMSNGDDPNDPFYLERQRVYDKYIDLIGDTAFNWKSGSPDGSIAILTPVSHIVVTCDKDYTGKFPAGSNLSSLFTVFFDHPYATIKNGYKAVNGSYHYEEVLEDGSFHWYPFPVSIDRANLAEVDFSSLPYIGNQWDCHLDLAPDQTDTYTFFVKMTLVDGTVLEGETPVSIHIKGKN